MERSISPGFDENNNINIAILNILIIMPIPDYQTIMLSTLKFLSDGREHKLREIIIGVSDEFNLTENERKELLPSGHQPIIDNRVGWAKTYLSKAGLVSSPRRGYAHITDRGKHVISEKPKKIDVKFLEQFSEFKEFRMLRRESTKPSVDNQTIKEKTPDEQILDGMNAINVNLAQEILNQLHQTDPSFFERVIGQLLTSMNYGEHEITGGSGDGGVDGIVNQDKLGLDRIFFQAKRYGPNNPVTARDVRDFVGTLDLRGVNKGLFITTSRFPKNTKDILSRTPKNIILIDGPHLANLMIEYDVGVSTEKIFRIKKIDIDFFSEE